MQSAESLSGKHTRLARQFLDDARREIAGGDTAQGGEKLWGAASHALKAYCASRNIPHAKYAHRRQAVRELEGRLANPSLWLSFRVAEACHANFYNDWMEQEELEEDLQYIEEFVAIVLSQKAE